ncbi:hypothetical protein GUITHDRAFT_119492 [Guillardia theta CCMP2712]|uniref:Uncharacterized protein n=1 Tax=Guillardia theta (strain CCMP2712) TaxID=905079 RepID=L1IDN0_GUITC|nr:hypothetical protein GUITHDRAFT_119492 [Guillardia theta CCMP2712]EKX34323.1 hypothetical protein GUITHDRAFT_119492 [Guillardia theta CCMP2712]|eukprot:XP_005821303.1 hypothetical protein GUITHDRAFT_119492 [Guillardia theta CCMP2712]
MDEMLRAGFDVTAEAFHACNLERVRGLISQGLIPGVTSWCSRCKRITPLVPMDCEDAGVAMVDIIRRHESMDSWLH